MTTEPTINPPRGLARVTQVALVLNGVLHSVACIKFIVDSGSHGDAAMARRAAAAGFAAAVMFILVARRIRGDLALIVMPIAFVFCNLADSIYDLATSGDPKHLGSAVVEALFLTIYTAYFVTARRASP